MHLDLEHLNWTREDRVGPACNTSRHGDLRDGEFPEGRDEFLGLHVGCEKEGVDGCDP